MKPISRDNLDFQSMIKTNFFKLLFQEKLELIFISTLI